MSEALTQGALDGAADDLPRTLRREREARYREALQKAQRDRDDGPAPAPVSSGSFAAEPPPSIAAEPRFVVPEGSGMSGAAEPGVVTAIRMPFFDLVLFFLKAALAAIPALILLGMMMWGAGWLLQTFFPSLLKMRIFIDFPR